MACFLQFLVPSTSCPGSRQKIIRHAKRQKPPSEEPPTPWPVFHCPIRLHLQNTNSKLKLFRILGRKPQSITAQAGHMSVKPACTPITVWSSSVTPVIHSWTLSASDPARELSSGKDGVLSSWSYFINCVFLQITVQADLRDMVDLVPDHHHRVNVTTKQVTIFWFPSAYKSYAQCATALHLKK